jgi:hypothetical protein
LHSPPETIYHSRIDTMNKATGRRGRERGTAGPAPAKIVAGLQAYRVVSSRSRFFQSANGALKLDWNEATAPPSPRVFEALSAYLATGRLNWYPDPNATELRRRLARYTGRPSAGIQVFNGSDSAWTRRPFLRARRPPSANRSSCAWGTPSRTRTPARRLPPSRGWRPKAGAAAWW